MITRRAAGAAIAAAAVAGLASGCLSSTPSTSSNNGAAASGAGKSTVEVMYGFSNEQETAFQKDVNKYAQSIGVTVKFTKAGSWDTEINARVSGGTPPDVGLFPQPGLMCDLAKQQKLIPYDDATVSTDKETLVNGFVDAGTCADGKVYGLPSSVSVKSLLWYDQAAFKAGGYTVPTTLDELTSLTDKIRGEGKTPWCIAAESGQATGWPITDWIEDLVLRYAGPDNYDKWVKGELKFNSPEIKPAFDYFQKIAFTDGNVRGGTKAIVATNFQTGGNGLFTQPPGCYLFKQATFIAAKGGFPDNVVANLDKTVGVTAFPAKTAGDNPVEAGGDLAAAFNNDANVLKIRNFIASKDNGTEVGKAGYFSPHKTFDASLYPNNTIRTIATDVLYKASVARFDGSDLMPAKVGAGTFWTEPVKWISGQEDETTMLDNIDKSFPKTSS
ncbi:ABC transporter substrate-binding protein [Lapillicoccus jejuensis]|uniref:Alpha-glucoside transport system substrate-binding protein n=1 Tax=Lapillicoccus jejuensis TaxID=402171 RepID=A0A542DWE4_9MICO|nr:extracellular solute-binding protein [Lapillicoccus jejuensis]TQJ07421.1 alpha-glucoside transport system substrate-binding protein [Lapillicoccus jejuensis]